MSESDVHACPGCGLAIRKGFIAMCRPDLGICTSCNNLYRLPEGSEAGFIPPCAACTADSSAPTERGQPEPAPDMSEPQEALTERERETALRLYEQVLPDVLRLYGIHALEAIDDTAAALVMGLLILRGPAALRIDTPFSEAIQLYRAAEQAFDELRANQAPSEAPPAVRGQDSC